MAAGNRLTAMAMALFADEDYEEVAARLTDTLSSWGCWDDGWSVPTSGGITQARQRLGHEPLRELFAQVAVPVADHLTRGAFLGPWRVMAIDGFEWDAPSSQADTAEFGDAGGEDDKSAFAKIRVVTVSECASHAVVDAEIGGIAGKGSREQALARRMYPRLDADWLLIADRNFYNWADWCAAADTGAQLLWRAKAGLRLPHVWWPRYWAQVAILVTALDRDIEELVGLGREPIVTKYLEQNAVAAPGVAMAIRCATENALASFRHADREIVPVARC
ncbi:transposase domain-containing protein [Kutzneria sp. NPDC052558]|uniref:transposase domain-containing protein n=1 Tax=Kutzneria sp. NPDC052558 TaxID=3364121 RepID=UPI0037CA9FF7